MAAKVELIVRLIKVPIGQQQLSSTLAFETVPGGHVENRIRAIAEF